MNLFEHEAKDIFRAFGMPTPPGGVAYTREEAQKIALEVGKPVVVKAQVLAGKRGKAGGVKFADTPDEAARLADDILAMRINDLPVEAVIVEEKLDNKKGSLQKGLERSRKKFRRQCQQDPKYRDTPIIHYGKYDCTDASYTKGMIAFWILYRLLGEQVFFDIYRNFHLENRERGAKLEDFLRYVNKASEKDLSKFFDEWIYPCFP